MEQRVLPSQALVFVGTKSVIWKQLNPIDSSQIPNKLDQMQQILPFVVMPGNDGHSDNNSASALDRISQVIQNQVVWLSRQFLMLR